ncbi:alpha-hydroxy-acid oxidizing protein [Pseudoroseomonas wenyumeiae]|uniref:Alpha-hydroxy-acid oxidizing protein n=1 Tax=Teichococcus wenyumeiae TaxID=2478470 RepID=A0A3A9JZ99_9PROT|nr:alpha-hydroxy acid oxidase [Pseudoroseomonas wenyumeiae]RKK04419.1 alpha-hydroxy-acid oxidizing protein [Pseudoroseomonas wenyumeiae]RMI19345.1 alpha-hydroxy-acid oxidizing protein [Pseudoroseomonas wenyumeiae]
MYRAVGQGLPRRLRPILALEDFEPAARRKLPRPLFGYIAGAAETNAAHHDNRTAFAEWAFRPRYLINVSQRSIATTLLGQTYRAPFGISPMGISAMMAYRGDLVLARAAQDAGIAMVMSGSSLIPMEDVARAAPGSWFQAYLPVDEKRIAALVERVARAGFGTLVLTVDTTTMGNRENNIRTGFSTPLKPSLRLAWDGAIRPLWLWDTLYRTLRHHGMPHFENNFAERGAPIIARNVERDFGARDHLDWSHIARIRQQWKGKLVIKGILHGEDARRASAEGIDGVIVSNHGGRQLDGAISAFRALPEVRAAAGGMAVMMDGGIRRGADVLKALAMGADFVFVGRPFLYAAAVGGEAGVRHGIEILGQEVDRNLALLGCLSPEELGPQHLMRIGGIPQPASA